MLSDADYSLCGHRVYTGVCVADGRAVEDDWVMFDHIDLPTLTRFTTTIMSSTHGLLVSVNVAVKVLELATEDTELKCSACDDLCKCSWNYCEGCLRPLCSSCVCPLCVSCDE